MPGGRAGGDVSVLTAAVGSIDCRSSAVTPEPWRRRYAPAKPGTKPRPPSSSATRLVLTEREAFVSSGPYHRDALPLSDARRCSTRRRRRAPVKVARRERGRVRPPGPAHPWSHAMAYAPSAPGRRNSGFGRD